MKQIIELTSELLEIKNEYLFNWSLDEIESFVEYIIEQKEINNLYDVDDWFEETKLNCPELLY